MNIRIPKVRVTRPGGRSPLERPTATRDGSMTGLDYLTGLQNREAAEHDRNVRDYSAQTLEAAFEDLKGRVVFEKKDPEHRWVMNRRAALVRRAQSMQRGVAA